MKFVIALFFVRLSRRWLDDMSVESAMYILERKCHIYNWKMLLDFWNLNKLQNRNNYIVNTFGLFFEMLRESVIFFN